MKRSVGALVAVAFLAGCPPPVTPPPVVGDPGVEPVYRTPDVPGDPDDPALWINVADPSQSLILGTDKAEPGGLHVYNLLGEELADKTKLGLDQPNNVDIQTGFDLDGTLIDIAVVTERGRHQLRVYRLPEVEPIDGGGLPVFEGEEGEAAQPAGVGLYRRPSDGIVFAHVSRDFGPTQGYLWTYRLESAGDGTVRAVFIHAFGSWTGIKDIETVQVDDERGVLYYPDEFTSLKKYPADPDDPDHDTLLAEFGQDGYAEAREGIALFRNPDGTGFVLVTDQLGEDVHVYPREGFGGDENAHPLIATFRHAAEEVDGIEASPLDFGGEFTSGLLVSQSNEGHFQLYRWADILAAFEPAE